MTTTSTIATRASFVALLSCGLACSPAQTEGEFMFLRNDGADLPVWVRGNVDSGVFIIWLTSGPGDPVEVMRGLGTDLLERDYAMVFWDQRGCGSAQGNPQPESFTMAQFVEDTDKVVDLIRARYEPEQIFLIGHSWGGTLATAYLLDADRQAKITGFIDLAGNHDFVEVFPIKLAWLAEFAERELAAGRRVDHWRSVAQWVDSSPPLTVASFDRWVGYVEETNASFFDPDSDFTIDFELLFMSPQSPLAYLTVNRDYVVESLYHSDEAIRSFSYSAQMHAIELPVLLLWGRHDGIVPLDAGYAASDALGTPEAQRRLVILEESGHYGFIEEPEAFAEAVSEFVEANR